MQLSPTAYKKSDFTDKAPDDIVEKMIYTDDVDDFAISPTEQQWPSDSMILYNACAEAIEDTAHDALTDSLGRLITYTGMINDYELEGETIMGTITPETAGAIVAGFKAFDGNLVNNDTQITNDDIMYYFKTVIELLKWAHENNYVLVFHCG